MVFVLATDHIDLYYQHRVNKDIPVEDIAWCMGILIHEGKILAWGQSQSTEEEIRRAHAITHITAIQSEYSMMERMFEKDVIPTCEKLGIGFYRSVLLPADFYRGNTRRTEDTPVMMYVELSPGSAKKMSWQISRFWI